MSLGVDVVIPARGHWDLTARCLDSLLAAPDACVQSVIVVDDASTDGAADRLRARTGVHAVFLPENSGFSAACNAGARAGRSPAIFFLNNDTEVPPGSIGRLAEVLADDRAYAAGPRVLGGDGTVQSAGLARVCGQDAAFERIGAYLDRFSETASAAYEPCALSGAALMVKRDAFESAGGFDEGFRNGYEDVDLCLRLIEAGGRLAYAPQAEIIHLEGASRGKLLRDAGNAERFSERWSGRLTNLPCWAPPKVPFLDIRWRARSETERSAARNWRSALRDYGGALASWNTPAVAGLRAVFDRRAILRISSLAGEEVCWRAPLGAADARELAASGSRAFWVPSASTERLMLDAGAARDSVHIVRLGFRAQAARERRGGLARLRYADSRDAALAALADASAIHFLDEGDPWGFSIGTAIASGIPVCAPADAPIFEVFPHGLTSAARDLETAGARERAGDAASELERRLPDVYAARRVLELSRALVHGTPDVRRLTLPEQVRFTR